MSITSDEISPPAICFINNAALFKTLTRLEMSTPFSNLAAASVLKLCRKEVERILCGLNHALSKKIFLVLLLRNSDLSGVLRS